VAKQSPEQKLAALAQEVGFDKLDSMFRLLRAYNTPKKDRKKKVALVTNPGAKISA
jgi:hypothetical protein